MKYGLKTVMRTPVKTGLFLLLIAAVTAFLALGMGMWHSSERMLAEADETFKTAGEFVFTLGHYPNDHVFDPDLASARAAFNLQDYAHAGEVKLLEDHVTQRALVQGFTPPQSTMPYRDYVVLTLSVLDHVENSDYLRCRVSQIHYANPQAGGSFSAIIEGMTLYTLPYNEDDLWLIPGRRYVMFGILSSQNDSRVPAFQAASFVEGLHIPESYGYCPPVFDVTNCDKNEFWQSEAGVYYQKIIDTLRNINESVDMTVSWDISAASAFHRGENTLAAGAFPDDHTQNACVISQRMASQLQRSVGDTITVSIHNATGAGSRYDSYWPDTGFAAEESFTITGIYQTDGLDSPLYVLDAGQPWIAASTNDYTIARVVTDNRSAEAFYTSVRDQLPPGVRLDLYNQGYDAATRAIYNMRETALLITGVCAAVGLIALWFFAYLFVYRNSENVRLLLRLGTGTKKTLLFLLTGSGVTALLAAALGGTLGYFISQRVIGAVYTASETNSIYDYRFSVLGGNRLGNTFTPSPEIDVNIFLITAAIVFALAMLLCALLSMGAIRGQNAHYRFKKASRRHKNRAASTNGPVRLGEALYFDRVPGVPLRYIARSITRARLRSLTVPLLFAVLLVFVFLFSGVREGYRSKLAHVYEDVPVTLWFTNLKGNMKDNLYIDEQQIAELGNLGFTSDAWRSANGRYMYLGLAARADGTPVEQQPADFVIPTGGFAYETFVGQLDARTNPLVAANDFNKTPEFSLVSNPQIVWAEGVNTDSFSEPVSIPVWDKEIQDFVQRDGYYCLASNSFLTENSLAPGDAVSVSVFSYIANDSLTNKTCTYVIAGRYTGDIDRKALFLPETAYTNVVVDARDISTVYYNAGGFTVTDPAQLGAFKNWLEEHYDQPGRAGRNRRWVLIDDKALYNTIDSLTRHVGYMDLLYPVMMAAVAAIGFIASSLLLKSRAGEITVLRGLGTSMVKVFCSFFFEPVFLSLPGILAGAGIAFLLSGGLTAVPWIDIPLLAACFYAGVAVAVLHTYRKTVLQSASKEE